MEDFVSHADNIHGGVQRYRHKVLHLLSLRPFMLTPTMSRAITANFAEFYSRGSLDWRNFSDEMKAALESSSGLHAGQRWQGRRMMACVCCARLFWPEDLKKLHIVGKHANWMENAEEAWQILSEERYSHRAPLIPREELRASSVEVNGVLVLLHKRRCCEDALKGDIAVPWCQECSASLGRRHPEMPKFALANHNWLGRLNQIQRKLMTQKYLGHRLMLSLARAVTTKVIFRPEGQQPGKSLWLDAFRAKGLKGSGIVFDNARRTETESFPPPSLGGSFIAVFVGCDGNTEHGVFGRIDAAEFRADAKALQEVNEVYAEACVNEAELAKWPKDGSLPEALRACCVSLPDSEKLEEEVPGTVGPAQMTSESDAADVHVVPPWTSAIDPAPEDDTSAPLMWSTLAMKLEEASDLGSRIRVRELEAKVHESSETKDELSREILLKTCGSLKECFKKLSQSAADEKFEELCAKVTKNESTACDGERAGTTTKRLIVPTGRKPLDLFDHSVWTKIDPVTFWYNDCVWAHPRRPVPIDMESHHEMCMRREELEYSTEEELRNNDVYAAPVVNRFRTNYKLLHMFQTSWSLEKKIRSVYSFTHRGGNRRILQSFAKLTPQMLADCYTTVAEHKTIGAVQRDTANVSSGCKDVIVRVRVRRTV